MKKITRRRFMKQMAGLSLCALGGGAILSELGCTAGAGTTEAAPASAASGPASPYSREAMYYTSLKESGSLDCGSCHGTYEPSRVTYCHVDHNGNYVTCQLCPKRCVISEGHRGDCLVRENQNGKLYTMVFGNPCAVHIDPIEKKPFYHYLPTSSAFSIATAGCNLHCLYCQNWTISQFPPEETTNYDLPPEKVVGYALAQKCQSIAYTYSEPTAFYEYMLTTARLARSKGIRNVVISAGYMNPAPVRELCRAVDAIKIDFKGFDEEFYEKVCFATLQPVLEAMKTIQKEGVHLEIVNLVVPTLNDSEDALRGLCRWIMDNLGPDVPTHLNRFHPQYKLKNLPPTPVETLERAHDIAKEEGINYAYIGNVPGHPANHTYCANCGNLLIYRMGFAVMQYHLVNGKCKFCGNPIPGVWPSG
ncbi:MAG: AmmeMemoRadiSam system radical SAM enzyme [Anaerolineae bacterium]